MAFGEDVFAVMPQDKVFQLVKKFKNHLQKEGIPITKIYIYGSYAKGTPRYGSDIDVCVISPAFKDRIESDMLLRREAMKIDPRIEPVGYTLEKFEDWIPLVWEIQNNGMPLD